MEERPRPNDIEQIPEYYFNEGFRGAIKSPEATTQPEPLSEQVTPHRTLDISGVKQDRNTASKHNFYTDPLDIKLDSQMANGE